MIDDGGKRAVRGQAIVMVSLGIFLIMGALGLVVDVGWAYYRKQVAQAAVDSAVMAAIVQASAASATTTFTCGSNGIMCQSATACTSSTSGTLFGTACAYGYQNGVARADMKVAMDTSSPINGVSVSYWITATVAEGLAPTFARMLGANHATVGASATAAIIVQNGTGGGCIYSLDPTGSAALQVGASSLTSSCGVYVNSSNSAALKVNGNGSFVRVTGGAGVNIVGGWSCTNGCGGITPTPATGVSPATDPLASLPAPSYSGCDVTSFSQSGSNSSHTLNPGVYCGGIKVSGGTLTLNSGNYILNGGGLQITGNNTVVTGTGVFFYNTSSGYSYGTLGISSQATVTLSAPTSGTYEGVLYFRDRTICPSTNDAITGNTNTQFTGSIYAHCANSGGGYVPSVLMFSGQSTPGHYVGLVADDIKITGNSNLILDPTGGSNTGISAATKKTFLIQ